jgi:hypothetical protein
MRTAGYVLCTLLAAAAGACAHAAPAPTQAGAQAKAATPSCPLTKLPGVRATVADIRDGVAITFTAPEGELDQLRNNIHAMADANDSKHDAFAECPCAAPPSAGAAEKMPSPAYEQLATQPQRIKAEAKVDEIATGAVLKLTAKDHKDINALRAEVREDLHALKNNCLARPSGVAEPQGGTHKSPKP